MLGALNAITGPSGGLVYHYFAWRYHSTLWRPYRTAVDRWLNIDWNPHSADDTRKIIIFGSSAGWSLPGGFLSRFDKIVCVEPDLLGRSLFAKRFAHLKNRLEFCTRTDVLPWFWPKRESSTSSNESTDPQISRTRDNRFESFLDEHSHSTLLFSNLLGQLALLEKNRPVASERQVAQSNQVFLETLKGRTWASYHDLFSGTGQIRRNRPQFLSQQTSEWTSEELVPKFFEAGSEVTDHETLWLSRNKKTQVALWEIRPGKTHVIGFVSG